LCFFGMVHLIALSGFWCFSWQGLAIAIFFHWLLGSIGICLGYHRMLSHRSLQVPRWLEYILITLGALAVQGGPGFWAGSHRQHHGFTEDVNKDPYSAERGFWWSHMLWVIYTRPEFFDRDAYRRFAPDVAADPYYNFLDQYFLLLQVPLAIAIYALGATQGLGLSFLIYGVFVRAVILWHSTWLINSACHKWGYRNFEDSKDHSSNLWWAALLTYGEGWHNNHHAYPKAAKAGLRWWEVDATWWVIALFQKLGWAKKVYLPEPWQLSAQSVQE
ncbi:MAG: acyl-CoA desaturase, partial [Oscillatoriales cyanobacterium SM2_2_1]|nr:acyl-CoA desaturase [Oscillatoriales cyanobacterium SM2_2_1]